MSVEEHRKLLEKVRGPRRAIAEKYGVARDIVEAKARTYELYLAMVPARLEPFPGAVELVRKCLAAGLACAVASSADRIKIEANLNKIGLPPGTWQAIVTAEDVEHRKPDPAIVLLAAQRLGVHPSLPRISFTRTSFVLP
jgi:beta-phosphoglucomutase